MKTNSLKKINMASVAVVIALLASVMTGCQKEEYEPLDDVILNSSELEEYIIAGADFQQSLANFSEKLNEIDFSTLEIDSAVNGWKKVVYLPVSLTGANEIEEKVQMFNKKKDALQRKFPQLISFKDGMGEKYFQQCIQNSVNVNSALLKLGINLSKPLLKNGGNEGTFSNYPNTFYLFNFLDSWVNSHNYVEAIILKFSDGYWGVYIDSQNTPYISHINLTKRTNNGNIEWYYNGRRIVEFGHTHEAGISGPNPSSGDDPYPGVDNFIYYRGSFYYYP
jgi:hypothetical protein